MARSKTSAASKKSRSKRAKTSSSQSKARAGSSRSKTATRAKRAGRTATSSARARGGASTGTSRGGRDAIALLTNDHKEMRRLLRELKSASGDSRRAKVLEQVQRALKTHTSIEEQIFYPAFFEAARKEEDKELFHEAHAEHDAADLILGEVSSANEEQFAARAKVLEEIVQHHAEEEESDMFPRARKLMDAEELKRLGMEMAEMKKSNEQSGGGAMAAVTNAVRRVVGQ